MKKIMIRKRKKTKAPTVVRGVRANELFFDMCDDVAMKNGITRNTLILTAVKEYCKNCLKEEFESYERKQ